jgi:hypothetical protein
VNDLPGERREDAYIVRKPLDLDLVAPMPDAGVDPVSCP